MNKKIKVAVIGCGTIGCGQHIPAYLKNENVEIKYLCDVDITRAENAVKTYNCGIAISDYREIVNDPDLDAVSVCTPNNMHAVISEAFLRAGKDVLCEKPASDKYSLALEMQQAQRETGRALNIGVCNRYDDNIRQLKEIIDRGELGEIYHVYASFRANRNIPGLGGAFTTKSIAGGGVMIDWGVHYLDIVMFCCGDPKPKTVSAETFCRLGKNIGDYVYTDMWAGPPILNGTYDVEDSMIAMIRTAGPTITLHGAWAQNIGEHETYIDFIGDKGGARLTYGKSFVLYKTDNGMLTETRYTAKATNKFENEINTFVDTIKSREKMDNNIDVHIISSEIIDAIYNSAEQHKEIEL